MEKNQLIRNLFDIQAVKFGTFKLKSGIESPIYLDLRVVVSYPQLLKAIADSIWSKIHSCSFDLICGVPYTALPIATAISIQHNIPMVMRRKEVKEYGTKKAIEGAFKSGQKCLIIEDLITSGSSVLETVEPLQAEGLKICDIAVLIDREQGGKQKLQDKGYNLLSVLTISELLEVLANSGCITKEMQEKVLDFIYQTQVS